MKTKLLALTLCSFLTFILSAQKLAEWGELRDYEMEMTVCSFDSTAEAVVLSDFAKIEVPRYGEIKMHRHRRIKILNESGKDYANIIISGNILEIEAQTINIEDGKIVKTPLDEKDFLKVEGKDQRPETRFSFPNVQSGSIIEFQFVKGSSKLSFLNSWTFQNYLPTLFSQVTVLIDHYYQYRISLQGPKLQEKYRQGEHNTWFLTNLQKIKDEPFCPYIFDYVEQIKFQLDVFYSISSGGKKKYFTTWEAFSDDLVHNAEFLQILMKKRKGNKLVATIIDDDDTPTEKVKKIFDYVSTNFQWDGYNGLYPNKTLRDLTKEKTGSAVEINTFLILMLRSAGFEADPVLISTKDHGIVSKSTPFLSQFNFLMCNVILDGKDLLLDATKGKRPYHLLYKNNLNRVGFLVHKDNPRWVEIVVNDKTRTLKMVTMNFENPDEIKYKLEVSARAYDAIDMRKAIKSSSLEKYIKNELIRENAEITIDSFSAKNMDDIDKPTFITTFITDNNLSITNDDYVYLNPFVDAFEDKNPFFDSERYLPIDLYYPYEDGYILNLTISDDYEVVEFPKSMNIKLAGDKGFLNFSSSLNNNKIQLRINLILKEYFFQPNEYLFLKELFDLYIEKRQELIVLKKIT